MARVQAGAPTGARPPAGAGLFWAAAGPAPLLTFTHWPLGSSQILPLGQPSPAFFSFGCTPANLLGQSSPAAPLNPMHLAACSLCATPLPTCDLSFLATVCVWQPYLDACFWSASLYSDVWGAVDPSV